METYNKIMQYFWLALTVVLLFTITYMGVKEGFARWSFYYIFAGLTFAVFLLRRFMMKRMKNHQEYLKSQNSKKNE